MKKKLLIIAAVILSILLISAITFKIKYNNMVKVIEKAVISDIDLTNYSDGIYEGAFKVFLVDVEIDVTIKNHTIVDVKIISQKCGPGYEAHDTIDRILRKQSPKVDATTGATGSSKGIMLAVMDALSDE